MIYSSLIGPLCISLCFSIFLEMVNAIIQKFIDIYLFINFKTILQRTKEGIIFNIDPHAKNCDCFLTLLRLQGLIHLVEYQVVFLLKTGIYLFASIVLGKTSVCYYQLKSLYYYLNMVLYLDDKVLQSWLMQGWERQKKLDYFFAMEKRRQYFFKGITLFQCY